MRRHSVVATWLAIVFSLTAVPVEAVGQDGAAGAAAAAAGAASAAAGAAASAAAGAAAAAAGAAASAASAAAGAAAGATGAGGDSGSTGDGSAGDGSADGASAGSGSSAASAGSSAGAAPGDAGGAGASGASAADEGNAGNSVADSAGESALIRFMAGIPSQDPQPYGPGTMTRPQLAAALYRSGHYKAAKELLCDERPNYDEFKRAGTPCHPRPLWDATAAPSRRGAAPTLFDPGRYRSMADCLTAAHAAGVSLGACGDPRR